MVLMVIRHGGKELWAEFHSHSQGHLAWEKMTLEKGNRKTCPVN